MSMISEKTAESLSVEIISTEKGFDSISKEWNSLVEVADTHIFQTYEWQRIWWKVFGGNNRLHILLIRNRQQLVGIMPLFLDHFRILGMPVYRCLRLIGSRITQPEKGSVPVELAFSDYLSVIAHPDYKQEVIYSLKNHLQSCTEKYNEIILEEISGDSALINWLLPTFSNSDHWQSEIKEASVCPKIEFPGSWDDLLNDLSSNARYQIRRDIRRVTDDEIFQLHTPSTKDEVRQAFETLVEFHQQRWHNLGRPGIFTDERILEFFREVTLAFHKKGWLVFKNITAEGKPVAIDLLFKFKKTLYMIQRGFDDSSEYNDYGPGNILLYCVIKEAIENGLEVYDFLRGEEKYKLRTANCKSQNKEIIIQKLNRKTSSLTNCFIRNYAHLKRKVQNERHVIKVQFDRQNFLSAFGLYLKKTYDRGSRKLGNIVSKK